MYGSGFGLDSDLGDYPLGYTDPDRYETKWDCTKPEVKQTPKFVFYSEEELCTSEVFQKHLNMALSAQEKYIEQLRQEIIDSV